MSSQRHRLREPANTILFGAGMTWLLTDSPPSAHAVGSEPDERAGGKMKRCREYLWNDAMHANGNERKKRFQPPIFCSGATRPCSN